MSLASAADVLTSVRDRLTNGAAVNQTFPDGSHLYIDRPLPFLCVVRRPTAGPVDLERLVTSQAAYLIAGDAPDDWSPEALVETVADVMVEWFGGFLLVELWEQPEASAGERSDVTTLQPAFRIQAPESEALEPAVDTLAKALKHIQIHKQPAEITVTCTDATAPSGHTPLLGPSSASDCFSMGLAIKPDYRNAETGAVFPFLFEQLRRDLDEALKQAAGQFARICTSFPVPHHRALGRQTLEEAVEEVDRELAAIDASFDFLLQTTPLNTRAAWQAFEASGFEESPLFHYRPLPVDPELLKRRLFNVPIEQVEDPALALLFREKAEELDRQITMLRERDTRQFFYGSLQLFGEVDEALLALAEEILERIPPRDYDYADEQHLGAAAFARMAHGEFAHYRLTAPDFPEAAQIRSDLPPSLMVSRGQLLIGDGVRVPTSRAEALLQHEVGTHMLTYFNGSAQPFCLLRSGLAEYEALQEGLAVLSEFLVGGLTVPRLRVLAARVVASHCLIDEASFIDVFRLLTDTHAFTSEVAFTIVMRTFRGGGFIKDVIYLRGLYELLTYLQDGGTLDSLFTGKIGLHHLAVLNELEQRGILAPVPLRPRYLDRPAVQRQLKRVQSGLTFIDLVANDLL